MSYAFVLAFAIAAAGGDGKLIPLTRLETGGEVSCPSLSPDATSLFGEIKHGKLREWAVWDVPNKSRTVLAAGADIGFAFPSPDRSTLLTFIVPNRGEHPTDVDVAIRDIKSKSKTALLTSGRTLSNAFSSDGNLVAFGDGVANTVHIWKRDAAAKWNVLKVLDAARGDNAQKPGVDGMVFTPDGKEIFVRLLLASGGSTIKKLDIASGKTIPFPVQPLKGQLAWPFEGAMIISRDGKTLCVDASEEEGAVAVDALSGKRKYAIDACIACTLISPDGATCATVRSWPGPIPPGQAKTSKTTINLWSLSDGTRYRTVTVRGGCGANSGAFTANSHFFVLAAGEGNRRIDLIEVEKAKVQSSMTADAPVGDISRLDSGEIAVVGIEPKAVVIWKFKPPE